MRAVIVGGGIAGASIARVLSRRGVDVTLLEKSGQLCSGATWHAAGLVTRFAGSSKLKKIHVRSLDLLEEVHDAHDINLKLPGSIRLVEQGNPDRLAEAWQHLAIAKLFDRPDLPTEMISLERIAELHPLMDVSGIECGLWTPRDGYVDPTMLTTAVAKEARAAGASIRFNTKVEGVTRNPDGSFAVTTAEGETLPPADICINAAGLWSRNVTQMVDPAIAHPAWVIEHQYVVTEAVPELEARDEVLPVLRDLAGSSYIRQEQKGFLIGPYESETVIKKEWPLGPPDSWGMELFPDQLERITPNIAAGMELIPQLQTAGFKSVVNGPTIWQGDGLPRVGRTEIPGYYDFNSLTYGIAQSLALAEYLGHLILHAEQPYDATDSFDPLRYSAHHTMGFVHDKISETYTHNNRVVYPHEHRPGGLEHIPLSPVLDALGSHGAQFGSIAASAVPNPLIYDPDAEKGDNTRLRNCRAFSQFEWADQVERETAAVLSGAAVGYSSFSKLTIAGPDAEALVKAATTAVIPSAPMVCRLTYALAPATGRVHSEYTVCRRSNQTGEADFYLVGSREHAAVDAEWFRHQARGLGLSDVTVVDRSEEIEVLHVAGPESAELLGAIDDRVLEIKFFHAKELDNFAALGVGVTAVKMSFTGEAGYELHVARADAPVVLRTLIGTSPPLFGGLAANALRIEKGYQVRADFDFAHYSECGIEPFISKKRDFLGKATVSERDMETVLLEVAVDPGWEWSLVGDTPIVHGPTEAVVGYTTTAARGARTGVAIVRGFLDRKMSPAECRLESYGRSWDLEPFEPL